jgi:hypothetical protein
MEITLCCWGAISAKGSGNLVEIKGLMDGPKYVRILQKNLMDSARKVGIMDRFVFQQDNDPKHISRIAKNYFSENNIEVMDWPSQSPDLNVNEHVWAYVKRKCGESPATNKKDAIQKNFQIWEDIPSSFTQNPVNSIYNRLEKVIKMKCGATKY